MDIVTLIKMYREKSGLSLNELSKKSGVGVSTLSRLENRETEKIDFGVIMKLKTALNISDFDLMMSMELYENEALHNMDIKDVSDSRDYQCNVCGNYYNGKLIKEMSLGHRNQTVSTTLCKACRRKLVEKLRDSLD